MTDMDTDGSHIKGLIFNFIHYFWPSLLHCNFISDFTTPLLKAKLGTSVETFYNTQDYLKWRQITKDASKYTIKYYKGLGTNTTSEAIEYFKNFDKHHREYRYKPEIDDDRIQLVFDKDMTAKRKQWILNEYNPMNSIDLKGDEPILFSDFINKELIHFSHADNLRYVCR